MSTEVRRVDYFYVTTTDRPGEAYKSLRALREAGVNLLAFNIIPMGPERTQFVLFPDDTSVLAKYAEKEGLSLIGPHHAFLATGKDRLGALADVHKTLADGGVDVYASNGVASEGTFGYVLYVKADDFERAAQCLGI